MGLSSANEAKTATQLLGDDEWIFPLEKMAFVSTANKLAKRSQTMVLVWYGMVWYGKLANVLFYAKVIGCLLGFFSGLL